MENLKTINVHSWLENQIVYTMKEIELNRDDDTLLSILDKYISMKKKYEGAIDPLSETLRVMEDFATFIQQHYPKKNENIKKITHHFLNDR